MNFLRNLFGVFACALFLVLVSPAKADFLLESVETLTNDEEDWYPCVSASGYCVIGTTTYWGVDLP